jgi:hypothetical protein
MNERRGPGRPMRQSSMSPDREKELDIMSKESYEKHQQKIYQYIRNGKVIGSNEVTYPKSWTDFEAITALQNWYQIQPFRDQESVELDYHDLTGQRLKEFRSLHGESKAA